MDKSKSNLCRMEDVIVKIDHLRAWEKDDLSVVVLLEMKLNHSKSSLRRLMSMEPNLDESKLIKLLQSKTLWTLLDLMSLILDDLLTNDGNVLSSLFRSQLSTKRTGFSRGVFQ